MIGISKRVGLVFVTAALAGCALQQQQVEQDLQDPKRINCRTAHGDIRMLQSEKASVAQQIAEGATAIYPAGLVLGLAAGTEGTKITVATGEYNQMIDDRIAEIRAKCGI